MKKIQVSNFKNFKELDVSLGNFNVLVGANASGKSNFLQVFRFLRDIADYGLENAISMQGGVEYLRNIKIGPSQALSISIADDREHRTFGLPIKKQIIGLTAYEMSYEFTLKFKPKGVKFDIVKDTLTQKCAFVELQETKEGIKEKAKLGEGKLTLLRHNGEVEIKFDKPNEVPIQKDDLFPPVWRQRKLKRNTLLLEEQPFFFITPLEHVCSAFSIYDFDPKIPKKATPMRGKAELEEDGTNLAIVLNNIIQRKNTRRKFFNLLKDLLPFIHDIDVEQFADKSLLFKLRETYSKRKFLPASMISDGTINITALIIALYFSKKPTIIIEEPERNIHPHLISKVVDMAKDASQNKQVILTTHNSEIVKYSGLDNILFVSRDKEGFSTIFKPGDKKEVKTFLDSEIGIEELYIQDLLGV